jgi:hypothetical protein
LVPTVASTLENTASTFTPVEKSSLAHLSSTYAIMHKLSLLVYAILNKQGSHAEPWNLQRLRLAMNLGFIKPFWIETQLKHTLDSAGAPV